MLSGGSGRSFKRHRGHPRGSYGNERWCDRQARRGAIFRKTKDKKQARRDGSPVVTLGDLWPELVRMVDGGA